MLTTVKLDDVDNQGSLELSHGTNDAEAADILVTLDGDTGSFSVAIPYQDLKRAVLAFKKVVPYSL